MSSSLIESLLAAVAARPDDVPLRLHVAELLVAADRSGEAIAQLAAVLAQQPQHEQAQALMARALGGPGPAAVQTPADVQPGPSEPDTDRAEGGRPAASRGDLDWKAYEEQFADSVPPRFAAADDEPEAVQGDGDRVIDVETSDVRLADVGGMVDVKKRLELAFLAPMKNPKLRELYGKSLRGGLLLYGPPGCGKTFLARAVAGEMGAKFTTISLVDVLNMWIGESERNLHEIFETARRNAPCVIFLDEVDALGHKRSQMKSSAMRTLGNQLLAELDGMEGANEGVFVLAATNAPWDVDPALRRPGRLDRTVLVAPPDATARRSIIEYHLRQRPIAGIDLKKLAASTEQFSGADLAHLCETATEYAMHASITSGDLRMIEQRDFEAALREVRPSTGPWFTTARNVAMFANEGGAYDELVTYLKKQKLL
ncbi:tetratricopeptide repeat protein [Catellatospora paridis]|uniref:tetratricopeptide repeat protein n=1 Tax=Catellatospora paridis TaxID=1617086 RepID=UPI0012D43CE9|nr:tetratricopeptide repeat protein [Catellatospora paridis]